jgi:hypothetical protein
MALTAAAQVPPAIGLLLPAVPSPSIGHVLVLTVACPCGRHQKPKAAQAPTRAHPVGGAGAEPALQNDKHGRGTRAMRHASTRTETVEEYVHARFKTFGIIQMPEIEEYVVDVSASMPMKQMQASDSGLG